MGKGVANQGTVPVRADARVGSQRIDGLERVVRIGEVVHFDILLGRCHRQDIRRNLEAGIAVIGDAHAAGLALFGRHDDDAVGGANAVDRRCGSVLEHRQRLDIAGGEEVDVVHEGAVHDIERVGVIADGTDTADLDGRAGARSTALGNLHAADHALEGAHRVRGDLLGQDITLDIGDRGREVLGFLGAVADDNDFFEQVAVQLHQNPRGKGRSPESLRGIAHAADFELGVRTGNQQDKGPVEVGGHAVGSSRFDDGDADGRSVFIFHDAFHPILAPSRQGGQGQECQYE